MLKLGLVLVFGLALLPVLAASRARAHTTVFYWSLAALILWVTGLALALGDTYWSFRLLAYATGPASASLFLLGALRFARRSFLPAIPVLGTVGALLTGLVFYAIGRGAAVGVEIAVSFPMLAASAWVVNEAAWRARASIPEKALGGALVCLALLMPVDLVTRMYVDADRILLPTWATLAFTIGFLTLASLAERAGRRARRLTAELEERTVALEVEHGTLLALLESSPLGILLADPPGRIRYLNARGAELLGLGPPGAWQGKPATEIAARIERGLTPGSRDRLAALVGGRFSARKAVPRVELELADGSRLVELVSRPVRSREGRCLGRLWMARDITEERRLAERLGHAQRMETVGTLAGGIAHDFNNQLTAILGNLDLLRVSLPEDDPRRPAVGEMEASTLACAELTQRLLTFAQRRKPSPAPVPVEAVVKEVVALLRPGLPPGVTISSTVADDCGFVLADAGDLRRVLLNLGLNARDAVAGHGAIRIEARRLDPPQDDRVELLVADDGAGMDEATRRRIFDPFFTTKELGKGTGLGLSVVYGIVEAHGARIDVESAPGAGTAFRLSWPAASGGAAVAASPPPAPRPTRTPGATVLLAEDDPGVRRSARGILERAGYRVIEADDGPASVARFRDHDAEVDLLLLDLGMPGCSGLEALSEIRRLAPGRPAILMSGNPDPYMDRLPFGSELLLKPFAASELLRRVEGVLDPTRSPDRAP